MDTFFSSDYHFFHKNILKYVYPARKQFMAKDEIYIMEQGTEEEQHRLRISDETIQKMNNKIIFNHNERIKNGDTINFLGDFGFFSSQNRAFRGEGQPYNPDDLINQMNGKQWYFIKGNHDKTSNKLKTKPEVIILNQNGTRIQLIHDPLYAKVDYDLILCGHVHNNFKVKELYYCGEIRLIINVGIDVWNMRPVKLDEILSIYHKWRGQRNKIKRWEQPPILKELNKGMLADAK